jgi:hypothetical protein
MNILMVLAGFLWLSSSVCASAVGDRVTDRTAIERVYYEHRLGTKPPFEQTLPHEQVEKMVKLDLKKEAILKRVYKIDIKQTDVDTEVQRVNLTTKAPEVLNEIKKALGNDPKRFADTVARPIVVERELRQRFQNDDKLHAPQREQAEQIRKKVLATKETNKRIEVLKAQKKANPSDTTWQLAGRPNPVAAVAKPDSSANPAAQAAQVIPSPPNAAKQDEKLYFEDLDPELQKVLRAQLQKAGDVSAVIETPGSFLLFVAKEKTAETLTVASLTIPKRTYNDWLTQQPD